MNRPTRTAVFALAIAVLAGCGGDLERAPRGGYCCPIDDEPTCHGAYVGGWVEANDLELCPRYFDVAPDGEISEDELGCPIYINASSCIEEWLATGDDRYAR